MNRIVHFEIHAQDMDRMEKFYSDCFGWTFQHMGDDMGNYRVIVTGEGDRGINGGMTSRKGDLPKPGDAVNAYICIISVENIDEAIGKVQTAGGIEALAKMDVPHVGKLAYYKDPEGNIFGMLEPAPDMTEIK
jgi:predicted enzyme related to lactoylglutathione lyase